MKEVFFPKKSYIFYENDETNGIFFIINGWIEVKYLKLIIIIKKLTKSA